MRRTLSPAILPASFVASRCALLKYAGNGDDGVGDRLAEVGLGVGLQLLEDHRGDLRRRVLLAFRLDANVAVLPLDDLVGDDLHLLGDLVVLATDEALDREDRVGRVRHLLALCGRADEPLAVTSERDDGRRRAPALGVRDDGGLGSFEHGHAGVGRAEVDSDRLSHGFSLCLSVVCDENLSVKLADHECIATATRPGPVMLALARPRRSVLAAAGSETTMPAISTAHPSQPAQPSTSPAKEDAEQRCERRLEREEERCPRRGRARLHPGRDEIAERAREHSGDQERAPYGPASRQLDLDRGRPRSR